MDVFYLTISTIAIIFLILILTFFGIMMKTHNKGSPFPPVVSPCPDYWNVGIDGKCSATAKTGGTFFNTGTLTMPLPSTGAPYTTSGNSFDPQDVRWSQGGKSILCAQRDWCLQNSIEWSGVSNYNSCS